MPFGVPGQDPQGDPDVDSRECEWCVGSGLVAAVPGAIDPVDGAMECPWCHGSGGFVEPVRGRPDV